MQTKKTSLSFRFIKWLIKLFYPKIQVVGEENLPEGAACLVGNHSQIHGPIACELYFPGTHYTWCAGQMMHAGEIPDYAFQDFWSGKPWYSRWFFRLLSYLIVPLALCIFKNANTIGVYRDSRILSTFKNTVSRLQENARIIIFPECYQPFNNIVYEFQENFVDVARLYYKKVGKALPFVPMYIAPRLKTLYLGKPIYFQPQAPIEEERKRICACIKEEITAIARSLPLHTVVPYPNIPKKDYPTNLPFEDTL